MNHMNPKVDFYFNKDNTWQLAIESLRAIVLDSGLSETLKWGCPCYTFEERNIVLIHVFKEYGALLFFKGALLKDAKGILIQQTENVQAARQMRFTSQKEVLALKTSIKAYIKEAIEIEKSGLKVPVKTTSAFAMPEEFQQVLDKNPALKKAFEALTPGRQRAYLMYFAAAKQSKTREVRIEKSIQDIMAGKGLND